MKAISAEDSYLATEWFNEPQMNHIGSVEPEASFSRVVSPSD